MNLLMMDDSIEEGDLRDKLKELKTKEQDLTATKLKLMQIQKEIHIQHKRKPIPKSSRILFVVTIQGPCFSTKKELIRSVVNGRAWASWRRGGDIYTIKIKKPLQR
ncbi:hypothetical protein KHA80_04235 [Anaerobacillus sp. HL2]|nr:hypothetical protein KHA80_04235 [Anaerobacillus sp. HL2]